MFQYVNVHSLRNPRSGMYISHGAALLTFM